MIQFSPLCSFYYWLQGFPLPKILRENVPGRRIVPGRKHKQGGKEGKRVGKGISPLFQTMRALHIFVLISM